MVNLNKIENLEHAFKSFVRTIMDIIPKQDRQEAYEYFINVLIDLQGNDGHHD